MNLVTLQEAKDNMLVTFSASDADIDMKIAAASGAVLNYLKSRKNLYIFEVDSDGELFLDSQGLPVYERDSNGQRLIRPEVKQATLLLVGIFFRDRDGAEADKWEPGFLPRPVTALLYPLRDPALA
jgi:hypothetical protein